jgi:type IV secretion system protein VirB4
VLATFTRAMDEIEDQLHIIGAVRLLRARRATVAFGEEVLCSELLKALVDVLYYAKREVGVPPTPVLLSGLLGLQDLAGGVNPRLGGKHVRTLSIAGFPSSSYLVTVAENCPVRGR